MSTLAGIALGGALGALARYGLDGAVSRRVPGFPLGTLLINVSGSFLLGLLLALFADRLPVPPWLRSTVAVGFLGAYTTFSTWSFDTYRLLESGSWGPAAANVVLSAGAGLLAVGLGTALGRAL